LLNGIPPPTEIVGGAPGEDAPYAVASNGPRRPQHIASYMWSTGRQRGGRPSQVGSAPRSRARWSTEQRWAVGGFHDSELDEVLRGLGVDTVAFLTALTAQPADVSSWQPCQRPTRPRCRAHLLWRDQARRKNPNLTTRRETVDLATAAHPALVTEAEFIAAQHIHADRPHPRRQATSLRALSGLARCGVCRRRMDSHGGADRPISRVGMLRNKPTGSSVLVSWLAPAWSLRCSFEVLSVSRTPAHRECW